MWFALEFDGLTNAIRKNRIAKSLYIRDILGMRNCNMLYKVNAMREPFQHSINKMQLNCNLKKFTAYVSILFPARFSFWYL